MPAGFSAESLRILPTATIPCCGEIHNATTTSLSDFNYADVAAYVALEWNLEGSSLGQQFDLDCLNLMYDGHGMVDEPHKDGTGSEHGIYQTYKLALYIYAQEKFGKGSTSQELETLLRMQGLDGGSHTGYDQNGTYAGTVENAETTSTVIIAFLAPTANITLVDKPASRCTNRNICYPRNYRRNPTKSRTPSVGGKSPIGSLILTRVL